MLGNNKLGMQKGVYYVELRLSTKMENYEDGGKYHEILN